MVTLIKCRHTFWMKGRPGESNSSDFSSCPVCAVYGFSLWEGTVQSPGDNCCFSHVPLPPSSDSSPELPPHMICMYFTYMYFALTHFAAGRWGVIARTLKLQKKKKNPSLVYASHTFLTPSNVSPMWTIVMTTKDTKIKAGFHISPRWILWQALFVSEETEGNISEERGAKCFGLPSFLHAYKHGAALQTSIQKLGPLFNSASSCRTWTTFSLLLAFLFSSPWSSIFVANAFLFGVLSPPPISNLGEEAKDSFRHCSSAGCSPARRNHSPLG